MTNEQILQKMKEDMEMRGFSEYTKYSYLNKTKHMMKYFEKTIEEVTIEKVCTVLTKEELSAFLMPVKITNIKQCLC